MTAVWRALTMLALHVPLSVAAAAWPPVDAIRFVGNDTTRERVMLREMTLGPGDPADPAAIEASRQAILDLGLFRDVAIASEPGENGVTLVVTLDEKWYVLPVPRLDASSDRDVSYGAELRWNNVMGRNHTLEVYAERSEFEEERDREDERHVELSYDAPYLFDTPYALHLELEHLERGALDREGRGYDETFRRAEVLATRDFTRGRPRRGWTLGAGLYRDDQTTSGAFAPPSDGVALAAVGTARYDDLRFHVYSETGRRLRLRAEIASDAFASDYDYSRTQASYFASRAFGEIEHQTLHFLAGAGVATDGPRSRNTYSLGGSGALRGYGSDFLEGDAFYYVAAEYLRPIRWDWLRLVVLAELGGADRNVFDSSNADLSPYASIGLGVRIRLVKFVDVELELGIAMPLRGGDGARFFAGGN